MKTFTTILFFFIVNTSICQVNETVVGYCGIFLGESKATLLKKINKNHSQKRINGIEYVLYKNIEIGLDDFDVIDEITVNLDSDIKIGNITIKQKSKTEDIINAYGEEWGYYGKPPVYLDYENGLSFETDYFINDSTSTNLSANQQFLNSRITSIIISESEEKTDETYKNYEYIDGVYIPTDLKETLIELDRLIDKKDKKKLLKENENDFLSSQHFTLGQFIRNEWGLWKKSRLYLWFIEKGAFHPDDISTIILKHYYSNKNRIDFNLENEINTYKEYWNNR